MPKTLLLADDSVTIQKVVGITFANEDIELITVDNGDDALVRARQIKPQLVLADIAMPGLNGYELCAAIKRDSELSHVPVLLLTGTFESYDTRRAEEVAADGHIAKPFEAQALIDRVNSLLERPARALPKPSAPEPVSPPTPPKVVAPASAPPRPPSQPSPASSPAGSARAPSRPAAPADATRVIQPLESGMGLGPDARSGRDVAPPARQGRATDSGSTIMLDDPLAGTAEPRASQPTAKVMDETSFLAPSEEDLAFDTGTAAEVDTAPTFGKLPPPPVPPDFGESGVFGRLPLPNPPESEVLWEPSDLQFVDPQSETTRDSAEHGTQPDLEALPEEELPWVEPLELEETDEPMPELELDSAPILAPLSKPPRQSPAQIPPPPPVARPLSAAPASPAHALESAAPAAIDSRLLSQSMEKVAWEAFGSLSELIVRDVLKKVEEIAWEVMPQLAERLLREEIARLKAEASRD